MLPQWICGLVSDILGCSSRLILDTNSRNSNDSLPFFSRVIKLLKTSWWYRCAYLFCIWCLIFSLILYCSPSGFNILSKSACIKNGTLNWYWPSWNFNCFSFAEDVFDLIISTSEFLVDDSCRRCTKTMRTVPAKVTCSFIGCIHRLKQHWQVLACLQKVLPSSC